MARINISQLIRHLFLLMLFVSIPHLGGASTEKPTSPTGCLQCHNEIWQKAMTKRYIHTPFLEKKCTGCHTANSRPNEEDPVSSCYGDEFRGWKYSLIEATSHWFEFDAGENPAIILLEASYGPMVRIYREIPIPPLDTLTDIGDVYGRNPPKISNVQVLEVKKGIFITASISWQTDQPTGSVITYGVNDLQQTIPLNGQLRTEHLETLSGLKHGQTYQFKITAEDAVGNNTESDIFKFSTATTFAHPVNQTISENCCLVAPLGLKSKFFRRGDLYLINITGIRPVKIVFALKSNDHITTEAPNEPEAEENQSQITKHIITNKEGIIAFIVCKSCHRDLTGHHPVNVFPKKGMKIPADYPTMDDGRISCISCHAPHSSDFQYRMIKDHRQELCIGCHNSFNPTGNYLLSRKHQ